MSWGENNDQAQVNIRFTIMLRSHTRFEPIYIAQGVASVTCE